MPELPEVETTARFLHARVAGRSITDIEVLWGRTVATHEPKRFNKELRGRKISAVTRRGKFVVFNLSPGPEVLLAHMRMSGSFDVLSSKIPLDKHDRVALTLSGARVLRFNDPRKFGRMYLVKPDGQLLKGLGIEPLSNQFSIEVLKGLLQGQRARIKPFLLRQDRIAGLGNIYVDEALWNAKIHPMRSAGSLRSQECVELHRGIRGILEEAIRCAGTDFGDGVVAAGGYEPRAYGRTGKPCLRCHAIIRRLVVGQRGTHICPRCQRAPRKTSR